MEISILTLKFPFGEFYLNYSTKDFSRMFKIGLMLVSIGSAQSSTVRIAKKFVQDL